jgi:cardiolipin synthase
MEFGRWWNAPNLLTFGRLVLAVVVVIEVVARHPERAVVLFLIAALTDFLDGWAARATHTVSALGQLMDPVADKVLISGLFAAMAWTGDAPLWFVGIVFGRDLFLLAASPIMLARAAYSELQPTKLGKLSTLLQIITALLLLLLSKSPDLRWRQICFAMIWFSAAVTLASGAQYGLRGLRKLKHR